MHALRLIRYVEMQFSTFCPKIPKLFACIIPAGKGTGLLNMAVLNHVLERSINGPEWTCGELLEMLAANSIDDVCDTAEEITRRCADRTFNLCSIINAKSGRCTQDCAWCAQSSRHDSDCMVYPLMSADEICEAARRTKSAGIRRFSIVASGRKLSRREAAQAAAAVEKIKREVGIEVCASVGLLRIPELEMLKKAGLDRIHCNLETSPAFFGSVCTTHSQDEKIRTLLEARSVGLDVCSGGLFGMGESLKDRIELALVLKRLEIPSIPLNILVPIKGTPLESRERMSEDEFLETAAVFRLVNPSASLRFAGGRDVLGPQAVIKAMKIGVNAAISGNLLTTIGSSPQDDRRLIRQAGYEVEFDPD